jgi:hypothetical protein
LTYKFFFFILFFVNRAAGAAAAETPMALAFPRFVAPHVLCVWSFYNYTCLCSTFF